MIQRLVTRPSEPAQPFAAPPRSAPLALLLPRLAAAAAGAGAVSHVFMLSTHSTPVGVALAVLMATVCVPCAVSLWRRADPRSARMLMVMSLIMVAIHGFMLTGSFTGAASHAGHAAADASHDSAGTAVDGALSMMAVMVCDYIAAALAALWLSRLRAARRRGPVFGAPADSGCRMI